MIIGWIVIEIPVHCMPLLRPPRGVCEARLHRSHKPFAIAAIPEKVYGSVCQLKETTIIHSYRFVMALLHWYKVCELGGDKLHRHPVVALMVLNGFK